MSRQCEYYYDDFDRALGIMPMDEDGQCTRPAKVKHFKRWYREPHYEIVLEGKAV